MGRSFRWQVLPVAAVALLVLAGACKSTSPGGPPPSSGPPKTLAELQLAVLDAVGGRLDYCDPDEYPLSRGTPLENAKARLPMIQADTQAYQAILANEHLSAGQQFTDDQLIAINTLYKQMKAIRLERSGDRYTFDLFVPDAASSSGNQEVAGTVTLSGSVDITDRKPGKPLPCPICLVSGVLIATPSGQVPVQDIRVGMEVWTTDRLGQRVVGVVVETGSMEAPLGHEVVRLTLADGRSVTVSPAHPTADGRPVGSLTVGARFDGSTIVALSLLPYTGLTHDLLPSGPTGTYFANGILLGSTLSR